MKLQKIYEAADLLAPFALSKEFCEKDSAYDNSGIIYDAGREVTKILFSLDCSRAAAERAQKIGAELLFTHHPAIYHPVHALLSEGSTAALNACMRAGISVISAHLNLDCAAGGIDETLMFGLGGKRAKQLMQPLSSGGYGRVFDVERTPLFTYFEGVKRTFKSERAVLYGEREVRRVASFCGAGCSEEGVKFAVNNGADTVVSSDASHHVLLFAIEQKLNVILLTHYAAEAYGFSRFAAKLAQKAGLPFEVFEDERFL